MRVNERSITQSMTETVKFSFKGNQNHKIIVTSYRWLVINPTSNHINQKHKQPVRASNTIVLQYQRVNVTTLQVGMTGRESPCPFDTIFLQTLLTLAPWNSAHKLKRM